VRAVKVVLAVAGGLAAVAIFARFFLSQLGTAAPRQELAGVVAAAPPGFEIESHGELAPAAAAAALADLVAARPGRAVGVRFQRFSDTIYWLTDPMADRIEERRAGAAGTRTATVWSGKIGARLAWARQHGDFAVPGLPPPERRNLYH
jgi:hypothetical protein